MKASEIEAQKESLRRARVLIEDVIYELEALGMPAANRSGIQDRLSHTLDELAIASAELGRLAR